jgi:hypothetical protein
MIGKPYSGKLNVRFDEGELEIELLPLRQLSTLPPAPQLFYGRRIFHPRPQDGVFRCDLNKF